MCMRVLGAEAPNGLGFQGCLPTGRLGTWIGRKNGESALVCCLLGTDW